MKTAWLTILASVSVGLTGCQSIVKHDYTWSEYALEPGRVTAPADLGSGQEIEIRKGQSDESKKMLGAVGYHEYYGSEAILSDGIAYQLSKELRKLQFVVKEPAAKSLEIAVIRSGSQQATWTTGIIVDFSVKFGNGKTKTYSVRNASPSTVPRALDGAVALAVIEILNDPEAISYIRK